MSDDDTMLRIGLLFELKGGPAVIKQSELVAALAHADERTRKLAEAVAANRRIQIKEQRRT